MDEEDARALLELRGGLAGGGEPLRNRWLLEVQRRHEAVVQPRGRGRGQGRGQGGSSGQQRRVATSAPRRAIADFGRYQLPAEELGRGGLPEVIAAEFARRVDRQYADRLPLPMRRSRSQAGGGGTQLSGADGGVLTEAQAESLITKAPRRIPECAICLQDIEKGDALMQLPCDKRHAFHGECGRRWLCGRARCCPVCRAEVIIPQPRDARRAPSAPAPRR
eukprot:TRINITY_DN42420_c0_g1_i1.p1 TRINITY_DN42420_c0_g1~~TRINITY_DN42420_c0_g1_i1.p1  ORF type:complete len:221 (-),score=35.66 TRINITY_DN42420_c0_g1_i1:340-1002(-)